MDNDLQPAITSRCVLTAEELQTLTVDLLRVGPSALAELTHAAEILERHARPIESVLGLRRRDCTALMDVVLALRLFGLAGALGPHQGSKEEKGG